MLLLSGLPSNRQFAIKVGFNPAHISTRFKDKYSMRFDDLIDWCNKLDLVLNFNKKPINSQSEYIKLIQAIKGVDNNNQLTKVFPANYDALNSYSNNNRKIGLDKVLEWNQILKIKIQITKK